jgi:gluconolactonase
MLARPTLTKVALVRTLLVLVFSLGAGTAGAQAPNSSSIYRFDPALDAIVAPDAQVEKLNDSPPTARNPDTREGPVWVRKGGYLLYTVLGEEKINKWDPKTNTVSTFLADCLGDGLTLDHQGRLLWAGGPPPGKPEVGGAVVRLERDGTRTLLAKDFDGKYLNIANDLVYKSNGVLYFSELSANPGIYRLKNGKVEQLLTDKRLLGGGLAFSPDEKYLYLTANQLLLRFDVRADGTIDNGQVFIDYGQYKQPGWPAGFADGLKVDKQGHVYSTGPGGIWILSPAGKPLGTILNLNTPANFTFGDADGKSLYVTSRPGLYRIRLKAAGRLL